MVDERELALQVEAEEGPPLLRRLLAEFVGTLLLVAVGTGTATVLAAGPLLRLQGLFSSIPAAQQATFSQQFGALLANNLGDVFPVAFAFAAILAVIVYAFGGISGAHVNPAVTFALAIARRFRWADVPAYWVAQILGGIAGAFIVAGIYGQNGASVGGTDILFGATKIGLGINDYQAILAEAFITFILVTAIMAIAIDPRAPKGWSGLVIGLSLGAGILVTSAATGGSANFARSLGPFIASLLYNTKSIPWTDLYVYAVGPLIGGAAAALIYEGVSGLEGVSPAPRPGAATPLDPSGNELLDVEHDVADEVGD
ncbi:MAG: glycerol uptake facilitator protein [Actinomycetota bacterium]|jgi:glycerol uptake facilitator protein|nr:glycerol uptake facilitator protein [Actinomycetota bacterium]